jgi:hypothetical protein
LPYDVNFFYDKNVLEFCEQLFKIADGKQGLPRRFGGDIEKDIQAMASELDHRSEEGFVLL